jgi:hypothetical protein
MLYVVIADTAEPRFTNFNPFLEAVREPKCS